MELVIEVFIKLIWEISFVHTLKIGKPLKTSESTFEFKVAPGLFIEIDLVIEFTQPLALVIFKVTLNDCVVFPFVLLKT